MKRFLFFFIFCGFFYCSKSEDNLINTNNKQIVFVKTFGGSKNDVAKSVVKTPDGGYAILGSTQSNDADISSKTDDSFDFLLLKFSEEDTLEWSKTYGGSDDDRGEDLIVTNDGGFALLGYSKSIDGNLTTNAGAQDFWMIKTNATGTLLWQKNFGFSGADYGTVLIQTRDNGYLLTGVLDVTASGGQGNAKTTQKHAGGDVWAVKLDAAGNLEWSKFYGGSFTETPFGLIETSDNGYIIAASSDSDDFNITNNKGNYDFWILKINNKGALIWQKNFGGSEIDEPWAITSSDDGNFIIVGDTRSTDQDISNNNGAADVWMLKISSEGNFISENTIGGSSFDVGRAIAKTHENHFLIAGSSRSSNNGFSNQGQNDALILETDRNKKLLWQKTIGGSEIDFFYDVIQLNNNSIIAVGETSSANADVLSNKGFSDVLIVKLN